MNSMSMLELRNNANTLFEKLKGNEQIILSFRGKPVATISPILQKTDWESDSFLKFINSIPKSVNKKSKISNKEIDSLVYGLD